MRGAIALAGCSDSGQASARGWRGAAAGSGTGGAGEPDGGGASTGGARDGVAGHAGSASASGGTATSGGASGGSATGGNATGGNATGGNATGGNATGGNATAGSSVGGDASAGSAGTGGDGSGGQAAATNGCIVPLYTDPSDSTWDTIVQAKQAHAGVDVVAIVNPSNGPGNGVDTASVHERHRRKLYGAPVSCRSATCRPTTPKRGQTAVNADTDTWHASYPAVQGIFFDEQSVTPGDEAFYAAVAAHAKTQGLTLTVGNPGTGVPNSFLTALDVMLSYESAGTPALASLKQYGAHREQFGIIPYAASFDAAYVKAAAQSVRYVYITNDDLPNPWDTLPSYFDALLGALTAAP